MSSWHGEVVDEGVRQQTLRQLLPKVLPLFRPHRAYLITGMLLLALITAAQLTGPLILRHLVDVDLKNHDPRGLLLSGLAYAAVMGGGAWIAYLQSISLFNLGIRIITDLKGRLFAHVLLLGLDFHEQHSPGKLISRVESDTETLRELFGDVAVNLLRNALMFFGILGLMLATDLKVALCITLLMPVLFWGTFAYMGYMRKYWRQARTQNAQVIGYVTEYVQGVEVIQQYNYEPRARQRMHKVNLGKYKIDVRTQVTDYGFWSIFIFAEPLAVMLVLGVGGAKIALGTMTIGTLMMFFEFIRRMFQPIQQLSEQLNFIQRGMISVERVFAILETEPNVKDGHAFASELRFEHEIRFENVWFAYEAENWVLRDVSFTMRKGEKVAVVGASGGGKSTTVNLLLRFYDPQRGRITVDGRDIREFPVETWRSLIGLVLQDIYLFPGTVGDNLRVFNDAIPLEHVKRVSQVANADRVVEKLPGEYDGMLSERGSNLSVGERQLISFARALAYDPPILVLDEATSSVDPVTERTVQDALEHLLEGRTSLIVAHRLSTILNADQILVVHNGELVEEGTHGTLLEQGGVYAKLFRLQFPQAGKVGASPVKPVREDGASLGDSDTPETNAVAVSNLTSGAPALPGAHE
jgi:ATP-binding cassette subfamily B multidrug efflux pump